MKPHNYHFMAALLLGAGIAFIVCTQVYLDSIAKLKTQAVKQGHAYWKVSPEGDVTFMWRDAP